MFRFISICSLVLSFAAVGGAQTPAGIAGRWEGAIDISGITLPFAIAISMNGSAASATIDIQGAKAVPLQRVTVDGASVHFELPAGPGLAQFDGRFDGTTIKGTFKQGLGAGTFALARPGASKPAATPKPTVPYKDEDVTFKNGATTLAGSLSIPEGKGPFPAFVMVTGSGPQSRDEELFGFKVFGVIADYLARHGVATLRYDDRGVGGSTGSIAMSTTADFADDALAGVALLAARPEIDPARIGVFGHSEGGAAAVIAAAKAPKLVAFIIMLAGPAQSGGAVLRRQVEDGARSVGATPAQIAVILAAHQRVLSAEASNGPVEDLSAAIRELMTAQLNGRPAPAKAQIGDIKTFVDQRLPAAVADARTPWMRYFVTFDPAPLLAQITCPLFAIFGEKDTQVRALLNKPIVESALAKSGNTRSTVKVYPNANHLFVAAITGEVSEYPSLDKTFVPGLLDDLVAFVKSVSGAR